MGLLDWLTDGSLGSMGSGETGAPPPMTGMPQPPVAPAAGPQPDAPPPLPPSPTPAATTPTPDPTPAAGPPDPPIPLPAPRPPGADAGPPQQTFAPNQTNTNPISPPAPGFNPSPVAAGGGALTPDDARATVKSYQAAGGHAFDGYAPTAGAPTSLAPTAPGADTPYKLGDQTALGRALGIDPKSKAFNDTLGGLGAGLTAAGNSKGKSPMQALASGAGATIEGANKESHASNKDAQGYLTAAINAKKAGDDATYKTNYTAYLAAKLKSEQEAAASKDATVANKNDSPTQLYLAAQRNIAADPLVKGSFTAYQNALKTGNGPTDPEVQKAKAAYEQTVQERQSAHLAGVGLHPQTAADIAKQPGMTQANPVDAGAQGITAANISKKLQPGQYYRNPADGQVYQFKGAPSKTKTDTPAVSKPEPANPTKEKATTAADDEDEDD